MTGLSENPKLNRAKAEASIDLAVEAADLAKLWLSALGAIVILDFSATFVALHLIQRLHVWEKCGLIFLMLFVLFDIFAVARIAEHASSYKLACRNYLATSCEPEDKDAADAMIEVDKAKSNLNGAYRLAVPAAVGILLLIVLTYVELVFSN